MIIRIYRDIGSVTVEKEIARVVRVFNYNTPSGISSDLLTEAGSMIVASAVGIASETGAPTADGQVWLSDLAEPLKGRWQAPGGGGGEVDMTNKSGTDQVAGTVVINDYTNNTAFTTTTTEGDRRVLGVLSEDITNNATGSVGVGGKIQTVRVTGNVLRGQWLIASSTAGRAKASGYTRPPGAIGMAMTEYTGGSTGTVTALIAVDLYLGASKGKGYVLGGYTGAYIATAQVLNFVSETTATIAGAALSLARREIGGGSCGTHGYAVGGYTGANSAVVDKCTFSTDTTAAAASMPAARRQMTNNVNGSLASYAMGGYGSALCDKTVFSTDITAAQASANLSSARSTPAGYSSSTTGYAAGGYTGAVSATADKMPFSTETTAALATGNLSTARSYLAGVYSSTDGYNLGGNTGAVSALAGKMPFSSETNAATASANLSVAREGAAGLIGALAGWAMGGWTGAVSAVADKLTYSTDTTAAAAGANLPTASSTHAALSTTNY